MKMLVLCAAYPDNSGAVKLMYVHTRNLYYIKYGMEVEVLNFTAKKSYVYEGIQVLTLDDYKKKLVNTYNLLVCHAPNIKNHYLFLRRYESRFDEILLFFHGHEVLKINKVYSRPYKYVRQNSIKNFFQNIYDTIKLIIWRKYLEGEISSIHMIFVSKWMYSEFLKWTQIDEMLVRNKYCITYNGIGESFENSTYDNKVNKVYDFITVRSDLDGSKYAIDIVNNLAFENPEYKFLIIGRGKYFEYNNKAENVEVIYRNMKHFEIIKYLNLSKCALMPTRTDAQGLMMCEMASIGMPLITSDIPICHEIFDGWVNVKFIDNNFKGNLVPILKDMEGNVPFEKHEKFHSINTCSKEVLYIRKIMESKQDDKY